MSLKEKIKMVFDGFETFEITSYQSKLYDGIIVISKCGMFNSFFIMEIARIVKKSKNTQFLVGVDSQGSVYLDIFKKL